MRKWLIRKLAHNLEPEELETLFKEWIKQMGNTERRELISVIERSDVIANAPAGG